MTARGNLLAVALAAVPAVAQGGLPRRLDFRHDVLPHLQRQGCSSAYCHGGGNGQGGFKLSLFGGEPLADYRAIAVEFGGRRVDLRDPALSLVVQKGLGRLDHGGGRRLPREGAAHRALLAWIEAGAPWQQGGGREVEALALARRGDRLVATAISGGTQEDVTDRALFESTDPRVVAVGEDGRIAALAPGVAFAIARLGRLDARLAIVNAFPSTGPAPPEPAASHALDAPWLAHLAALGLSPIGSAPAGQLARRLHQDLVGRPPTPHELDRFTADPDVARTVRQLCRKPAFAEVWGAHLARWFEVPVGNAALRRQLVAAVAGRRTLRDIAAAIATGELPVAAVRADPRDRAELVARSLLGLRIGCARCHDHPGDRWQQRDFQAFSAVFAQAGVGAAGVAMGQIFDEATGERVAPRWLDLPGARVAGDGFGRDDLARFVADRGHGLLARNFANRVFAELFGRGLVEPVDDHRSANPARSEPVLAAITAEFDRCDGDLPRLLEFVTTSRLYGLDLAPAGDARGEWLAARTSSALPAEAWARAVAAVLGQDPVGALADEPLARELALRNGPFLRAILDGGRTTVDALFDLGATPAERLDELWRTVLSRRPRAGEVDAFLPQASQDPGAFRDLAMALLLGREFGHRR